MAPMPAHPRRRPSLRTWLPLLFAVPVVFVLASYLWATKRQAERALMDAGQERANLAAEELAGALRRSVASVIEQTGPMAANPAVGAFLAEPSPSAREAVTPVLLPSTTPAVRRIELWDLSGALRLEVATAPHDSAGGLAAYPRGEPPTGAAVSRFQAADTFPFFSFVLPIRADATADGPTIGYLRRYARLSADAAERIAGLVGADALIEVGTIDDPIWTDFARVLEPPPAPVTNYAGGDFVSADRQIWVGDIAVVQGTPWIVWVGFPRDVIVAPAQPFMRRMLMFSFILVAIGVGLVGFLGRRLTQPLHALAAAADRIAAGEHTQRVESEGFDEISRVGEAFNAMSERVEQAHRALTHLHERTQFALATAGIGIWQVQSQTGEMFASDTMRLIHPGLTEAQLESWEEFLGALDPHSRKSLRRLITAENASDVIYRTEAANGSARWIEAKGRIQRDVVGEPESVLGVSIDVTERRRLESQVTQGQKMEAIGQLAGGVAHDFNNLLTAILGHANLAIAGLPKNSALREDLLGILKAGESAAGLTRQLLTFSRPEPTERKVVDVNALVANTEQMLRRLIGANIAIEMRLDDRAAPVIIDPGKFEQVLVNLAVNARDAMPQGGRLSITTANVDLDDTYIPEGSVGKPGPHVMLAVSDTGTGMDEATRGHVFEPFFSTKPAGEGTGLGLATVFGIVRQSEGHIFVYSEVGQGTVFKIYLPAIKGVAPSEPKAAGISAVAGGHERILVVEDDAAVRRIASMILKRFGYVVESASTGEEALTLLSTSDYRPDLVITDVIMPGITGPELRDRLDAIHPGMRVLFSSGYSGDALARHAVKQEEALFIEKPYAPNALARKVREALDRDVGA